MRDFSSSFLFDTSGQSLVEILVAIGVGTILITAAASVITPALKVNTQSFRVQTGSALAKELLENVRVWSEGDWHNVANLATSPANRYYLTTSSSPFTSVSGTEAIVVATTTYTRSFYVDDVYRDAGDAIISSPGLYDPSTKKITVDYSWSQGATSSLIGYITRNRNNVLWQTDWSGGPGQDGPVTNMNNLFASSTQVDYATTTGSLIIKFQ